MRKNRQRNNDTSQNTSECVTTSLRNALRGKMFPIEITILPEIILEKVKTIPFHVNPIIAKNSLS